MPTESKMKKISQTLSKKSAGMNFYLTFKKEVLNLLILIGVIFALIGMGVGSSDDAFWLKWLQPIFANKVTAIDSGLNKELNFFPSAAYQTATLSANEPGFNEILKIIQSNDSFAPKKVIQITQRKDSSKRFYWAQKGEVGTIFLDLTEKATTQDAVYPVDFAPIVFGWIAQERARILTKCAFSWNFIGMLVALMACFLRIEVNKKPKATS